MSRVASTYAVSIRMPCSSLSSHRRWTSLSTAFADEASIECRLENARREMEMGESYDVRIVNDDLERAAQELERTIDLYESNGGSTKDVSD